MKKPFRIEFAPISKIDSFAHELIKELFNIEGAFLSDESALEDFLEEEDIPGHKLIRFKDIPREDRDLYDDKRPPFGSPDAYFVWYPPLTNAEIKEIRAEDRKNLISGIERIFGISMVGYPRSELLYVWEVAAFVKKKLAQN